MDEVEESNEDTDVGTQKISVKDKLAERFEGYHDKECPDFTDCCRRFFCALYDQGCDEECRKLDYTNKEPFLCDICDLTEKECKKSSRIYLHDNYIPVSKMSELLGDDIKTRDKVRDKCSSELALIRSKIEEQKQLLAKEENGKKRRGIENKLADYESQVDVLVKMLDFKNEMTKNDIDGEEDKEEDTKINKKKDPIGAGLNIFKRLKDYMFWLIIAGIIGGYIYFM